MLLGRKVAVWEAHYKCQEKKASLFQRVVFPLYGLSHPGGLKLPCVSPLLSTYSSGRSQTLSIGELITSNLHLELPLQSLGPMCPSAS